MIYAVPDIIEDLLTHFEGFDEIYWEIFQLRTKPEELIQMYYNIFYDADRNEDRLILEEMQGTIDEQAAALAMKDEALAAKDAALAEKDALIESLMQQITNKQ